MDFGALERIKNAHYKGNELAVHPILLRVVQSHVEWVVVCDNGHFEVEANDGLLESVGHDGSVKYNNTLAEY